MNNLFSGFNKVNFWVWVDPEYWLAKHNLQITHQLFSGGLVGNLKTNLPFIENPEFKERDMSVFQYKITNHYRIEHDLELHRIEHFENYPSRLNALYLFTSKEEAEKYQTIHPDHISKRELLACQSKGNYYYSLHDLSWIDFLRIEGMVDKQSFHNIAHSYWNGINVEDCKLQSRGKVWTQDPIREVLFIGAVEFLEKDINKLYS